MLIGLSRVSSRSQDHATQVAALERAGCERIFVETESGMASDRPELENLMKFARPGDVVVVYALSRLARGVRQLLALVDELTRREIGLKSLTEAVDTATPSGRLAVHLLASIAQHDWEARRERCAEGRRVKAMLGKAAAGGRPRAMDEHKLKVARALIAGGQLSMKQIAHEVGVAPSTLYRTMPGGRSASCPQPPVEQGME